jgi:hypothetical protein
VQSKQSNSQTLAGIRLDTGLEDHQVSLGLKHTSLYVS